MSDYVITAKKIDTDEAYLSAVFKDDKLMGIVQNKCVSDTINVEHIAKFLLAINSENRYYPEELKLNGKKYIQENTTVIPAIDVVGDNFVEIDF